LIAAVCNPEIYADWECWEIRGVYSRYQGSKRIIMTEEDVVKATVNNITSNILYFRLEMNFITNKARFFWRDDNRDWQQLGPEITMGFDWQFGTFQGEQYAILNFNPNGSNGYVDVDWFRLNDVPGPTPQPTTPPAPRDAFTKIEAETYNNHLGIQTEKCSEGGEDIGYIENGDFAVYKNVDFGNGAASFEARVASATSGGKIELRIDSINGPLIGTCTVAGTGDWQKWSTVTCDVSEVKGNHDLYLVFTGGNGYLFNINWFTFNKKDNDDGRLGDLNGDGNINSTDLQILKKHLLRITLLTGKELSNADVTKDGKVDSTDLTLLKRYILRFVTNF